MDKMVAGSIPRDLARHNYVHFDAECPLCGRTMRFEAYFDYGRVDETVYKLGEKLRGDHYSVGDPPEQHVVVRCDVFDLDEDSHDNCAWQDEYSTATVRVDWQVPTEVVFRDRRYSFDDFNGVVSTPGWLLGDYLRIAEDGSVLPKPNGTSNDGTSG
jgi:hypothetical protein